MLNILSKILNPSEMASSLIHQHGKQLAMKLAMEETIKAQGKNDNYSLSIWRDVKRILRERRKAYFEGKMKLVKIMIKGR